MKQTLVIIGLLISTSLNATSNKAKFVEKVVRKDKNDYLTIPYEKYVLPNGLTILLHEDHSDPIVHVNVTYHVGSARELPGRSGFAHFFEHMMFQGSDNVGDEMHIKYIEEIGGNLNGSTNTDLTNYYQTIPSNYLELVLWLEADRMGFLLDAVTQEKFEIQRATVKNERGQRYDNAPYGLVYEKMIQALYPFGHPYSWPVIGYIEDLNRATLDDLKNFFLRWYGPNNAVLIIAGDIDKKETIAYVEKYFGPIKKGPKVTNMRKQMVRLEEDKYISYEDNIQFPLLNLTYPTMHASHEDEAPLDILIDLIASGKTSLLYKNLVKTEKVLSASGSNICSELSGYTSFKILGYRNSKLSEIEKEVRNIINNIDESLITDDLIQKYITQLEVENISDLSTIQNKAGILASYHAFFNNPNYNVTNFERYKKVTKADVLRVYEKYLKNKPAVVLSVVPKGQRDLIASEDNFTPMFFDPENTKLDLSDYKKLKYKKAKDKFDRSQKPLATKTIEINLPKIWKNQWPNGAQVAGTQTDETPTIDLLISFKAGHRFSTPDQLGIATLLCTMLNKSTKNYSEEAMTEALEKLGSSISFTAEEDDIIISVHSLEKNIDKTLELLQEKLFNPKFDQTEFTFAKKQQLENIKNIKTNPGNMEALLFKYLIYDKDQSIAYSHLGRISTLEKLTIEQLQAYYNNYFSPSIMKIVSVGALSQQEIEKKLQFLAQWHKPLSSSYKVPEYKYNFANQTKIYFVDKPKSPQSFISIGQIAIPYDATGEYFQATIMNYPFGGTFNSRINLNLRENKGWTYGCRAHLKGRTNYKGYFIVSTQVKAEATDSAVVELMKEFNKYAQEGISAEELNFTKASMTQQTALDYENNAEKAGLIKTILDNNLSESFIKEQSQILNNIDKNTIDKLAKKYFGQVMNIVIVGDKAKYFDKLKLLGYPIEEFNIDDIIQ